MHLESRQAVRIENEELAGDARSSRMRLFLAWYPPLHGAKIEERKVRGSWKRKQR